MVPSQLHSIEIVSAHKMRMFIVKLLCRTMALPISGPDGPIDPGARPPANGETTAPPADAASADGDARIAALRRARASAADVSFSIGDRGDTPAALTSSLAPYDEVSPEVRPDLLRLIGELLHADDFKDLRMLGTAPGWSQSQFTNGRKLWCAAMLALQVEHCPPDQHSAALRYVARHLNAFSKPDTAIDTPKGWAWEEDGVTRQAIGGIADGVKRLSTLQMLLGPSDRTGKPALIDDLHEPVCVQLVRHLTPTLSRLPNDEWDEAHNTLSIAIGSLSENYRAEPTRLLHELEADVLLSPDTRAAYKLGDELVAEAKTAVNLADVANLLKREGIFGPPPLRSDTLGAINLPDGTRALVARPRPEPLRELARAIAKEEFPRGERPAAFERILGAVYGNSFGYAFVAPLSELAYVARFTGSQNVENYASALNTAWKIHGDNLITERQLVSVMCRAGDVLEEWPLKEPREHYREAVGRLSPWAKAQLAQQELKPVARQVLAETS